MAEFEEFVKKEFRTVMSHQQATAEKINLLLDDMYAVGSRLDRIEQSILAMTAMISRDKIVTEEISHED